MDDNHDPNEIPSGASKSSTLGDEAGSTVNTTIGKASTGISPTVRAHATDDFHGQQTAIYRRLLDRRTRDPL